MPSEFFPIIYMGKIDPYFYRHPIDKGSIIKQVFDVFLLRIPQNRIVLQHFSAKSPYMAILIP